ncbi:hypothetical protein V7S76_06520 [Aquirufa sp. ROCK2-A2]
MSINKFPESFQLFYESPNDVPAPYHLEAVFSFADFGTNNSTVEISIQYLDREDFTKEELLEEGLMPEHNWTWKGPLSEAWKERLSLNFSKYKSGSCNPKDSEPFITLELEHNNTAVPRFLEMEENLIQEFMQAIFEKAEKELPLYLGFQFKKENGDWTRIEGILSFSNLNFHYKDSFLDQELFITDWDKIQDLMNLVYIADFQIEKAKEEFKNTQSLAVYPGDGFWYVAGDSLRKPSGNNRYFDNLENKLQDLFN